MTSMNEHEVQTSQPGAIVNPYAAVGGDQWSADVDHLLRDQLPVLKVTHGNSKGVPDGVPPGKLCNVATQEVMDTYRCVLLYARAGQVAFPETFSAENSHRCRSNDAVRPVGDGSDPQPGPCRRRSHDGRLEDACPWLRWRDEGGISRPPRCATTYQLLLWESEGESGAILSVMRRAARAFQSLKTRLHGRRHAVLQRYEGDDAGGIPYNVLAPIEVGTVKEKSPRGDYFIPKFTILDDRVDLDWARSLTTSIGDLIQHVQSTDFVSEQGEPDRESQDGETPF